MADKGAVLLIRERDGRVLCEHCLVAAGPLSRMRGLLGRRSLDAGEGLLLRPAAAIHTAFMRFAIDAVFLDRESVVVHIAHDLQPWRTAARRGARTVLELPAGSARGHGLETGEKLKLVSPSEAAGVGASSSPSNRSPARSLAMNGDRSASARKR